VTDPTPLFRTRDGGRSWQPVDLDGAPVAGICAIDVLRSETIVEGEVRERVLVHAAGRANGPAQLLRSEDGGETWRFIDLSDRVGMILDVKFTDPSTGYVFAGSNADLAQSSAVILRTRDGGRSWREVYRSGRKHEILWKASFTEGAAYATLQNNDPANVQQRVVKSTDDGETWFELPLVADASVREYGIGFVDSANGWVGTSAGGFETRDGGLSWTPAALAPDANRIRVHAVDGSPMVYAIGREVQVYRTRSEGAGSN
jgi:photosystem II stability/assembly factor-like uncharacterized protein